ncbi:oxidized purine nucleoside triphosphate hydrolase-like isoform X2 [Mytilus californianus]|uniref:oxidized purine nucleoside triphosphate hydrolase-like isoform X2 n=1 Tax=Mytilus californianus TaxID=6549 RepID=UPI00224831C1|nr:oxidized purine nucleoside triphosphate hydrolase-like isoform X2 [Mytilus californianus]
MSVYVSASLSVWAKMIKILTLVLVRDGKRILLGMKKRGFGEGRWNGFGGKVEKQETVIDGAKRELREECGLVSNILEKIGLLKFEFVGDPQLLEVHVFTTEQFTGTVEESSEMRPEWFDTTNIPFDKMWPDDKLWFPLYLKGQKFSGYFLFQGNDSILKYTLDEVDDL